MKKLLVSLLALLLVAGPTFAQSHEPYDFSGRWYVGLYGGAHYNVYENYFAYGENDKGWNLITAQGGIAAGYEYNKIWSFRATLEISKNAGAMNIRETHDGIFRPYTFKAVDFFADAIVNIMGVADDLGKWSPKIYGGVGFGYSFGFTDPQHPWQTLTTGNFAPGFRLGGILQYDFRSDMGVYLDVNGSAFADHYNGLKPAKSEQPEKGYAGFPLDVKGNVSLGIVYRFN